MFRIQAPYGDSARAIEQPECVCSNLNSGDAFLVVAAGGKSVFLWLGQGANEAEASLGRKLLEKFGSQAEVKAEFREGQESDEFWEALGGRTQYSNVKDTGMALGFEPRLFQCSNSSGYFFTQEIYNFSQDDLVNDDIMLLDAYNTIFVWIGNRSNKFERNGAFSSAQKYLDSIKDEREKEGVQFVEVEAGKEQPGFTVHFPEWRKEKAQKWLDEDPVKQMKGQLFKKISLKIEEKKEEESKFLDPSSNHFSYEVLTGQFPEWVDPTRKEAYLTDEEFKKVFGMAKESFYQQKKWKQQEMRKQRNLF